MKCNVNKNHQKRPPNNLQGNNSKKDTLLPVDDVTEGNTQEAPWVFPRKVVYLV